MPLTIELQDELGGRRAGVDDTQNALGSLLPRMSGDAYPMLESIDPYGNTTFNRIQMPRFLREWAAMSQKAETVNERQLLSEIELLAQQCQDDVHLYLKFIGD